MPLGGRLGQGASGWLVRSYRNEGTALQGHQHGPHGEERPPLFPRNDSTLPPGTATRYPIRPSDPGARPFRLAPSPTADDTATPDPNEP